MKIRIVAALAVVGMFIFSCAPKVVTPVADAKEEDQKAVVVKNAEQTGLEDKSIVMTAALAEGKNLFENNCAKCHKLYNPSDYSAEQWTPIVLRMQKQAKIQDAEREKIYNYLTMK